MPIWDENKRRANIKAHGLDFAGCERIFDHAVIVFEDTRQSYGELRLCAIGWLNNTVVHLTDTERENDFRVISLRKAEKHEIKHYIKETTG